MFCHVDADSFFASIIQRQHPELKGKPLFAIGMGGGIIIAASYEAKAFGVHTGMRLSEARKLVPGAIERAVDFRETGLASEQIETILQGTCPLLEQMSIDEWYMDLRSIIGGVPVNLSAWATSLRERILRKTGLSMSVGIAPTKLLAKMASEYRKPGGVTAIQRIMNQESGIMEKRKIHNSYFIIHDSLKSFLRDRPAAAIPGIGRQTEPKVAARGWKTAWDIANAPTEELVNILGRPGREMQSELLGRPVATITTDPAPPKSVSRARSFWKNRDRNFLWAHLLRHLEYLVLKMRREGMMCRGISVWLRDGEYRFHNANRSLPQAFATEDQLLPFVRKCFQEILAINNQQQATQIGLALWRLTSSAPCQYSLFEDPLRHERSDNVQKAIDTLHEQFGRNAVTRASALEVKSGTQRGLNFSTYELRSWGS